MYSSNVLTSESIIQRIKDNLENQANRVEGSFASDNAQAVGKEIAMYYSYVQWLNEMHFVTTATGEYLDLKALEVGVTRKQPTHAIGHVTFIGREGTEIPYRTIVKSDTLSYETQVAGTIDSSGEITLPVRAVAAGSESNVPAEAIHDCDLRGIRIQAVINHEPIINGTDLETDDLLRERTLLRMRYPGTSGNQYHYMHWAMEVEGVGRVKVFPLWQGNGTVKVSILDSNQRVASQDLIDKVQMHIDPSPERGEGLAPIGAYLTVSTATAVDINVTADIQLYEEEGYEVGSIQEAMEAFLEDYLQSISYVENHLTVAKVIDILWSIEGVKEIVDLKINGATDNLTFEAEEIPVIGTVTLNVL